MMMKKKCPAILIIAAFDPSCGAGAGADIKTVSSLGCRGVCSIASLTAQNTARISGSFKVPPSFISGQAEAIINDTRIAAVKIGALSEVGSIKAIAKLIKKHKLKNIVADPVIKSSSGFVFMDKKTIDAYGRYLLPLVDVFTPNKGEAELFARMKIKTSFDIEKCAEEILKSGAGNIIIKGGHFAEKGGVCRDTLYSAKNKRLTEFAHKRVASGNTHGTGCAFSSAVASFLAKGFDIEKAALKAGLFMEKFLKSA